MMFSGLKTYYKEAQSIYIFFYIEYFNTTDRALLGCGRGLPTGCIFEPNWVDRLMTFLEQSTHRLLILNPSAWMTLIEFDRRTEVKT